MLDYVNQKHCPDCGELAITVSTMVRHVAEVVEDPNEYPVRLRGTNISEEMLVATNDSYSYQDVSLPMLECPTGHKWTVSKELIHYLWIE